MNELVQQATGIDFYSMRGDLDAARKAAQEAGIPGAGNSRDFAMPSYRATCACSITLFIIAKFAAMLIWDEYCSWLRVCWKAAEHCF
jgi:hypothetical protein